MRAWSSLLVCLTLATSLIASPGCSGHPPTTAPASSPIEPEPGGLVSVHPGINDRYFEDDAVKVWTDTLEAERREVIAERDQIVAALELTPGSTIADIGAGTGAFLAALSAGVGEAGTLLAIEIVPVFAAHLRERARAEGLSNVVVVEASATDVGLEPDSVDLLFMCDVYHHIEYPGVYLPTLYRALRPGGRLVIVEFDRIPGKTSERMMKHVRQDQATLTAEVTAAGFVLDHEIEQVPLDENYMLVFRK
ncbi:class I SAM-dependent methyltransferase [Enhygromyxa salina]|uniref:Ubiquinone/menaquinone biosynthesis C-methyltransferase UbiE n=1 Tax=Enhygromyxa salina TaxID=215803 RepID=A0A2S9YU61_9BACT|nr:methyltransferase domain-containing protein [Enhygromyxa salina]PRQ08651.1 Ubiquinone/menaquinone biosynthesis C-methyltransferase UbiE [Enhygromyxa salina]